MIGQLRGIIIAKQPPYLVVDVSGVGYELKAPMSTFYQLPNLNQTVTLLTHLIVREDVQELYAFYQQRERNLFRALIKVNGVGPKLALTILSGIEPDQFVRCIQNKDTSSLTAIPGIGKKTAERLIVETRDALNKWQAHHDPIHAGGDSRQNALEQTLEDAVSALIALGYKPNDAKRCVDKIYQPELSSEQLIRQALKQMISKGVTQ